MRFIAAISALLVSNLTIVHTMLSTKTPVDVNMLLQAPVEMPLPGTAQEPARLETSVEEDRRAMQVRLFPSQSGFTISALHILYSHPMSTAHHIWTPPSEDFAQATCGASRVRITHVPEEIFKGGKDKGRIVVELQKEGEGGVKIQDSTGFEAEIGKMVLAQELHTVKRE